MTVKFVKVMVMDHDDDDDDDDDGDDGGDDCACAGWNSWTRA